jgi:glyoxylase I family protein
MGIKVEGGCTLLQVFDMRTSLAFYRDILDFEVVDAAPPGDDCDWCLLKNGGAELMLNTQYESDDRPAESDPARALGHRDVGIFWSCRDLDGAYARLRVHGIDVEPPVVRGYGMKQLSFRDPDGYGLCFQWPAA